MIQIANLKIEQAALDAMPECLARENCVLPLSLDGESIRVAFGRREDYREVIDKLEFVLSRRIIGAVADRQKLEEAIDEVYTYGTTEVSNCPLDFRLECSKRWLELRPTGDPDVRFCESCSQQVRLCSDENEAIEKTQAGHCVAIFRAAEGEGGHFIGLLDSPFPIAEEDVPAFRAALWDVKDPLAISAADQGEFYFLDTKVFDQGYMEFCDNFAKTMSYPDAARWEMRRRREAIFPLLGKPILHGGISHNGLSFNVFIDKTSGKVIHYEVSEKPR